MKMLRRLEGLRGFTMVEIMVVTSLVIVAITFGFSLMVRGFSAEKSISGKVQVVHEAQLATVRLSEVLHDATELFAPAVDIGESRPFAVFSNHVNELMVLHVDRQQRLVLWNRNTGEKQPLASGVVRFRAYRRGRRVLNYHLELKEATSGEKLNLLGGVCIRNNRN